MLINPTIAILKDVSTGKWHPIYFEDYPMAVPTSPGEPYRQKSKGHHTEGFTDRDAAVTSAKETAEKADIKRIQLDEDITWDGKDIPALVGFVAEDKLIFF